MGFIIYLNNLIAKVRLSEILHLQVFYLVPMPFIIMLEKVGVIVH